MNYNFSYTTTASTGVTIDVTLQITLGGTMYSDGSYDITAIAGTWNGQTIESLAPNDGSAYGSPDDLFYPQDNSTAASDSVGYASFFGFGFTVDTSGPNAIAGDDGNGNVDFISGAGQNGNGDAEILPNSYPAVTNEVLTPACYCTGTLIRTPGGAVAIEELQAGDLVSTHGGLAQPVLWVGHRSYAGRFLSGRTQLYPVRIKASALAENVPSRDLLVSQKHAMLLGGVLVAAGDLLNGSSIVLERSVSKVDYFHVELADHDVIWAEDAASETFVDDGSRGIFQNAAEHAELPREEAVFCAPRVTQGFELEAIRRGLAKRVLAFAAC